MLSGFKSRWIRLKPWRYSKTVARLRRITIFSIFVRPSFLVIKLSRLSPSTISSTISMLYFLNFSRKCLSSLTTFSSIPRICSWNLSDEIEIVFRWPAIISAIIGFLTIPYNLGMYGWENFFIIKSSLYIAFELYCLIFLIANFKVLNIPWTTLPNPPTPSFTPSTIWKALYSRMLEECSKSLSWSEYVLIVLILLFNIKIFKEIN